jgi:arylsulfatase A-like enzyme
MSTPVPSAMLAGALAAPNRDGPAGDLVSELVRPSALRANEPEEYITMKPYIKLFIVGLCALCARTTQGADADAKPNIVYVIADQWRASATGYAGDPNVKTPNLDRLAKQSLNFRNAVSVLPVCTPHRAALLTGRFPTSTGMFLNDAHLPDEELCMAEILGAAGYATGYIGKWHLDGHGRESYIPPERRQGWQYWKAAECDHSYNHSHYYTGDSNVKQYWEGYDAFAQTKDAQQYLRDHSRAGRPFVLMLAYGVPHFPHGTAPEKFKAMYPPGKIKLPPNVPPGMQAKARQEAQGYYAHCAALDQCVGDLLGTLAETGLASNTIVVFSSDHGEMLGSQGVIPTQKQVPWSESARVPLLMCVPGIDGREVTTPITTPDVLPTLLGLTGVANPATIEGEDLSAMLRAGKDEDRAALYMSVSPFSPAVPRAKLQEYRAIQTSRYTYVRSLDGPWLLYDDGKDPYQTNNLVGVAEFAPVARDLDARLQAQLKKIGDDFRPGGDYLAEWGFQVAPHGSVPYAATITKVQTPRRNPAARPALQATKPAAGNSPTTNGLPQK